MQLVKMQSVTMLQTVGDDAAECFLRTTQYGDGRIAIAFAVAVACQLLLVKVQLVTTRLVTMQLVVRQLLTMQLTWSVKVQLVQMQLEQMQLVKQWYSTCLEQRPVALLVDTYIQPAG